MRVALGRWSAALAVAVGLISGAAPSAEAAKPYRGLPSEELYIACYLRVPGASNAYAFPVVKTNGQELFYQFRFFLLNRLEPLFPQHSDFSCEVEDTPELALKRRSEGNLSFEARSWPKGLPDGARPVYVAGKGYVPRDEALSGQPAPPPKAATAPKPFVAPALTLKTDTGPQDAAKALDEKMKKILALEAQQKVERAAKQAQSDAKLKADYEAFFAERRKQGSRQ
jgi:hypothetical protein